VSTSQKGSDISANEADAVMQELSMLLVVTKEYMKLTSVCVSIDQCYIIAMHALD
jgi:hypothetical protein